MPCPLFEPQRKVAEPVNARLPLIFEFEGICHGGDKDVDAVHRLRYCNRGYATGTCASFPQDNPVSAVRFNVTSKSDALLKVLVVEEENHWPRAWFNFDFLIKNSQLVPEIEDVCRRAQVFQFCVSYLEKF